jgi:hypothetical protein
MKHTKQPIYFGVDTPNYAILNEAIDAELLRAKGGVAAKHTGGRRKSKQQQTTPGTSQPDAASK